MRSHNEKDISLTEYLEEYAPGHKDGARDIVDEISLAGHLQRYDWALSIAEQEQISGSILDIGCGLGFGR